MNDQLSIDLEGPGQARVDDPETSKLAARLATATASSARVRLLEAHGDHPDGLTDEEAASWAGLSLMSEYATRCSELRRAGCLIDTGDLRTGAAGAPRVVRCITRLGLETLRARRARS